MNVTIENVREHFGSEWVIVVPEHDPGSQCLGDPWIYTSLAEAEHVRGLWREVLPSFVDVRIRSTTAIFDKYALRPRPPGETAPTEPTTTYDVRATIWAFDTVKGAVQKFGWFRYLVVRDGQVTVSLHPRPEDCDEVVRTLMRENPDLAIEAKWTEKGLMVVARMRPPQSL